MVPSLPFAPFVSGASELEIDAREMKIVRNQVDRLYSNYFRIAMKDGGENN